MGEPYGLVVDGLDFGGLLKSAIYLRRELSNTYLFCELSTEVRKLIQYSEPRDISAHTIVRFSIKALGYDRTPFSARSVILDRIATITKRLWALLRFGQRTKLAQRNPPQMT